MLSSSVDENTNPLDILLVDIFLMSLNYRNLWKGEKRRDVLLSFSR